MYLCDPKGLMDRYAAASKWNKERFVRTASRRDVVSSMVTESEIDETQCSDIDLFSSSSSSSSSSTSSSSATSSAASSSSLVAASSAPPKKTPHVYKLQLAPQPRIGEKVKTFRRRVWNFVQTHHMVRFAERVGRDEKGVVLRLYLQAQSTLGHAVELADEDKFVFWHPGLRMHPKFGEAGKDRTACAVRFAANGGTVHIVNWANDGLVAEVMLGQRATKEKADKRPAKKLREKGIREQRLLLEQTARTCHWHVAELRDGSRVIKRDLMLYLKRRKEAFDTRMERIANGQPREES